MGASGKFLVWMGGLLLPGMLCVGASREAIAGSGENLIEVATPSPLNRVVPFYYRMPRGRGEEEVLRVLVLVPGYNGDGGEMMAEGGTWCELADSAGLILLGPSFKTDLGEIHSRRGYYYPEQWSGKALIDALEELVEREKSDVESVLLFGVSAGAHFVHRFANWRPGAVRAFAVYSAGWWDLPSPGLLGVPALVMCGEEDMRYGAMLGYVGRARDIGLDWVWRGFPGTGHEVTPEVLRLARAFLSHHALGRPDSPLWGDAQTHRVYRPESGEAQAIPEELRVVLPSEAVAEAWGFGGE